MLSCFDDDTYLEEPSIQETTYREIKKEISVEELVDLLYASEKEKVLDRDIMDYFSSQNLRGSQFITGIDSTYLIAFADENYTTVTSKVFTIDESEDYFTNWVVKIPKTEEGEIIEYLIRYYPSEAYIQGVTESIDYFPFDGKVEVLDMSGKLLNSEQNRGECTISLDITYLPCGAGGNADGHGPSGGLGCEGSPVVYTLTIYCPFNGGGGSGYNDGYDDNDDNDHTGGGGGNTGGGGIISLPTDVINGHPVTAWARNFINLHHVADNSPYLGYILNPDNREVIIALTYMRSKKPARVIIPFVDNLLEHLNNGVLENELTAHLINGFNAGDLSLSGLQLGIEYIINNPEDTFYSSFLSHLIAMDNLYGINQWTIQDLDGVLEIIKNHPNINNVAQAVDKIITDGIEDVPCLMNIYNDLGESQTIQQFLDNFRDEIQLQNVRNTFNPKIANLSFINHDDFHANVNYDPAFINVMAYTKFDKYTLSPSNIDIQIIFNTDSTSKASIYDFPKVVATYSFIHEILHAEMFRYLWLKRHDHTGIYSEAELFDMLGDKRNDLIFNNFTATFIDVHHNVMALTYRNNIIRILQDIYPNMSYEQANALAWIGLEGTTAYNEQVQNTPNFLTDLTQNRHDALQNFSQNCP